MKTKLLLSCLFLGLSFATISGQLSNPILPGFYPDPSVVKAEDNYYLVNSSFSYFPGVPIFHSKDLVHWKQIGHVLDRESQLNLTNQGISRGIFAPAISYHDGLFYMITTFIDGKGNFFVTAEDPAGPWSDPVYLQINGIDPSFFFDEDGKAYIINNGPPPDNDPLYDGHRALWLQEFDLETNKQTGPRKIILNGGIDLSQKPVWIEGPHIYKVNGYYYLMAAEGGTSVWHSEVILRSKDIWGPYEVFGGNPILTQRDLDPDRPDPVTSAGHADLVQTPDGGWASVFLACRPYNGNYYNIGRETYLLPVDWSGEWPMILEPGIEIPMEVDVPWEVEEKVSFATYSADWKDEFNAEKLAMEWIFMRTPTERWYRFEDENLVLSARPVTPGEYKNPSFVARRQQHINASFETAVSIADAKDMEAGIVAFQGDENYYECVVVQSGEERYLSIKNAQEELGRYPLEKYKPGKKVHLRVTNRTDEVVFEASANGKKWEQKGPVLDGKYLSTQEAGGFVGSVFALYAFGNEGGEAFFGYAHYRDAGE